MKSVNRFATIGLALIILLLVPRFSIAQHLAARTATTAGSESGNTVTLTFASNPFPAGDPNLICTGITPSGYNNTADSFGNIVPFTVLTSSATQITYHSSNSGLGPITVQGSCSAPQPPFAAIPGVPDITNPNENPFQHQTHFLTFIGSFVPESAASAKAYYAAIDPHQTKQTMEEWLVNAGFIGDVSEWHPTGAQTIVTGQPVGVYGDNVINTDAHVIVLNAADLGFVRNQFIRCKDPANPNSTNPCKASNPIIYTYLENYPVAPFAGIVGGKSSAPTCTPSPGVAETVASCFPTLSGYPFQAEIDAAMESAIQRPTGITAGGRIDRIADVEFEWAPPAANPTSSTRFGQLYAYIFFRDCSAFATPGDPKGVKSSQCAAGQGTISETVPFPAQIADGVTPQILDFTKTNGTSIPINPGDPFAPNLDGIGFKQHPGVCLTCHGGAPAQLTSTGAYPKGGNINGFRFLPLDNRNLLFPSAPFPNALGDFTLGAQQPQIKLYNQLVLLTIPTYAETDNQGVTRIPHIREVIQGWYAADGSKYSNDTSMGASTQNGDFVPKGWREPPNGTAPFNSENVYKNVVGPSCRSCHFNRELSLDFGTAGSFNEESDLQQLALLAACKQNNPDPPDPNAKFMPLAHLTFQRFWQTQSGPQTLSDGTVVNKAVDELASYFGYGTVAGYCATNP